MGKNNQKIKLIKIMDFIKFESSPESPVTTNEIIHYLNDLGISCDRRTLYKDMALLMDNDSSIVKLELRKGNAYYYNKQNFNFAELKILVDAVQAANFITDSKTESLINKILSVSGTRKKEIIQSNIIFYNNHKHSNEDIFLNIEQIEKAIQKKKQITFYYFDLNEDKERVYREEKKRYIADPIALVYSEDNYYLVSYSQKYENTTNYRVDRIDTVVIEETPVCEEAIIRKRNATAYTEQVFKMYNGETIELLIEFTQSCIGAVYDKFGEKLPVEKKDDKFRANITVQVSPPFFGWLYQFGDKMKVLEPEKIISV